MSEVQTRENEGAKIQSFTKLGEGRIRSLLLEFSLPAFVGIIVQNLYNIIDGVYVGHGVGELGLAATTVSFPMMMFLVALSMLIGVGGNALVAIKLGEGKKDEAERIMGVSFVLLIVGGVLVTILGLIFIDPILRISGATDEIMPHAKQFMGTLLLGYILQSVGFGMNNFIRTSGAPNMALGSMLIGTFVNLILGYIFVLELGWGMRGAALATVCAWAVSCTVVLWFFFSKRSSIELKRSNFVIKQEIALRIMALGLAPAILELGFGVVNVVMNQLLLHYGSLDPLGPDNILAITGVLGRIGGVLVTPAIALMQGAQPIIGFNFGAKQFRRVRHAEYLALAVSVIITTIAWILILVFGEEIMRLFALNDNLMDQALRALIFYTMFIAIIPIQIIGANYFEATGQALKATVLTLLRQGLILIPIMIAGPLFLPNILPVTAVESVWISVSIADITSFLVTVAFLIPEMRKIKRLEHGLINPNEPVAA